MTDINKGVYYDFNDYASTWKRLLILFIDFIFLFIVIFLSKLLIEFLRLSIDVFIWVIFIIFFIYSIALKATPIGTLGYRLTGHKLVNLRGNSISFWQALQRFCCFFIPSPIFTLCDYTEIADDPHRQSFKDKLSKTYVVKQNALPIGEGPISLKNYYILDMVIKITIVVRPECKPNTEGDKK